MKIALTKTKSEKITPLQDINHPSIAKKTYKTKPQSQFQFSPLDGAQYAKFSTAQKTSDQKKRCKYNNNIMKTPHAYTQRKKLKEDLEQSSQSHYNSQFNLNKQAYAQYKNTLQKEQSDAPCNFIKLYHLYLMKIALIKKNQKKKDNTTSRYHPSVMKMTHQSKPRISSKFRHQMARNMKNISSNNNQQSNQ